MTQFMLAWHGFPSGTLDGHFGARTAAAVRRFQGFAHARRGRRRRAGDARRAAASARAFRRSGSSRPVPGGFTDGFGPRGNRFHTGLDFPAAQGARVRAAASGRVARVGWDPAGYGRYVVVRHSRTASTWYAHLSATAVAVGQRVARGARIGSVGSTGSATGPHVHFELRVRGAAVDPARVL